MKIALILTLFTLLLLAFITAIDSLYRFDAPTVITKTEMTFIIKDATPYSLILVWTPTPEPVFEGTKQLDYIEPILPTSTAYICNNVLDNHRVLTTRDRCLS